MEPQTVVEQSNTAEKSYAKNNKNVPFEVGEEILAQP